MQWLTEGDIKCLHSSSCSFGLDHMHAPYSQHYFPSLVKMPKLLKPIATAGMRIFILSVSIASHKADSNLQNGDTDVTS